MRDKALSRSKKRTNVRLSILRVLVRGVAGIAPSVAARASEYLFLRTPRPQEPSARAQETLDAAERREISRGGHEVVTWRWGFGPAVLLLHGWGGRASQMTSFVEPILQAGFSAVALDAPGHGESRGRSSSLPAFANSLRAVAESEPSVVGIVAHSLGGAAAAFAAGTARIDVPRLVLLGSPSNPERYYAMHMAALGVPESLRGSFSRHFERLVGATFAEFFVPALVKKLARPVLVIHDREDAETPFADGRAIATSGPRADLFATKGLGHRRILRDADVVRRAVAFLTAGQAAGAYPERSAS